MPTKSSAFDVNATHSEISARVRQVIGNKRGAIAAAARRYGIPAPTIRQYRTGVSPPSAAFLARMVEVDGVSAKWLITGQGPQQADPEADAAAAAIAAMPPTERDLMLFLVRAAGSQDRSGGTPTGENQQGAYTKQ